MSSSLCERRLQVHLLLCCWVFHRFAAVASLACCKIAANCRRLRPTAGMSDAVRLQLPPAEAAEAAAPAAAAALSAAARAAAAAAAAGPRPTRHADGSPPAAAANCPSGAHGLKAPNMPSSFIGPSAQRVQSLSDPCVQRSGSHMHGQLPVGACTSALQVQAQLPANSRQAVGPSARPQHTLLPAGANAGSSKSWAGPVHVHAWTRCIARQAEVCACTFAYADVY